LTAATRVAAILICGAWVCAEPSHAQPEPDPGAPPDAAPVIETPVSDTPAAETEAVANALELRFLLEDLIAAGDLEGAAELIARLLDLTEAQFGPESTELAEAHLLIGELRRLQGDYLAAEESILSAIEVYESQAGPLSAVLIGPFLNLGDTYNEAGDYTGAISAYSEARTIGRRIYGLLNEDQIEIIDDMTQAAVRLGQIEEAVNLQLEALTLVERTYDTNSLEAVEARYKFADWLRETGRFQEARLYYFEIQRIISREYDDDPVLMARLNRERAESYRDQDIGDSIGLSGLKDSVESLEELPDPPALLVAELYLDLGDWNVEFGRSTAIGDDYLSAWEWLGRVENGDQLRREWFDGLTVVEIDPISRRGLSNNPDDPLGYVEIHFTVDVAGRARDVEVANSFPPNFKDSAFIRQYREARFRPRIVDGAFVEVRRARRNEFHYIEQELE